jgi:hypothetical protein
MLLLPAILWQGALKLPAALRQASLRQARAFMRDGGTRPASLLLLAMVALLWVASVMAFLWWVYPYIIDRS